MATMSLKEAESTLSSVIEQAAAGEFITITRHGKPLAVVVSVDAAEAAKKALSDDKRSLIEYLAEFPADVDLSDEVFARNSAPGREIDL